MRAWVGERKPLLLVLGAGLALRLALAFLPGFPPDIGLYRDWAQAISTGGPGAFYNGDPARDYAPGYLYVLWFVGDLHSLFHFSVGQLDYVLKLPPIAADLAGAWVLYLLVRRRSERQGLAAAALYLALPPTLLLGAIWGQSDAWLALFMLLTVYLIVERRALAAGLAFTAGFLVKPQIAAAFPFLAFWFVRDTPPRIWLRTALWSGALATVLVFPFFPSLLPWRPLVDLAEQLGDAADRHQYNAIFAANLWQIPDIAGHCDVEVCRDPGGAVRFGTESLGLTPRAWGVLLFLVSCAVVIYVLRDARGTAFLALGTSLCLLAFFVFMTRMHERYMFPVLLTLLAASALLRSKALWGTFSILAAVHFLNLYDVYVSSGDLRIASIDRWLEDRDLWGAGVATIQVMSLVVCGCFVALLVEAARVARLRGAGRGSEKAVRPAGAARRPGKRSRDDTEAARQGGP